MNGEGAKYIQSTLRKNNHFSRTLTDNIGDTKAKLPLPNVLKETELWGDMREYRCKLVGDYSLMEWTIN